MEAHTPATTGAPASRPSPFGDPTRVVSGVDGSRTDEVTVREACALAGPRGHVALVCVMHTAGVGATAQATITEARATDALGSAMHVAKDAGRRASAFLLREPQTADALLDAAEDADALVVGTHGGSRAGGIALGGVATHALHRARVPVLIARPRGIADLGGAIVVASDGSPGSERACLIAGELAHRSEAPVCVITVDRDLDPEHRDAAERQTAVLAERIGRQPSILWVSGRPVDAILENAASCEAALLVLGSGGRTGLPALGSVSERVAHRARCSVLVARGGERP